MDLTGRVALVTGGATGIGRATILRLARSGAAGVAINYRTARAEAEQVAEAARQIGAEAICVHADVKSDEQVRAMVRQVDERFGRLDVLVNTTTIRSRHGRRRTPLRRVGTPEDVAGAIVGLITGGDFVSGQTLIVDGGLSLS